MGVASGVRVIEAAPSRYAADELFPAFALSGAGLSCPSMKEEARDLQDGAIIG